MIFCLYCFLELILKREELLMKWADKPYHSLDYEMKLRFGENLSILIDIPQSLHHYCIPKLVIQPLIENAVFHGTSKISGRGIIAVLCSTDGTHLQIFVKRPFVKYTVKASRLSSITSMVTK